MSDVQVARLARVEGAKHRVIKTNTRIISISWNVCSTLCICRLRVLSYYFL